MHRAKDYLSLTASNAYLPILVGSPRFAYGNQLLLITAQQKTGQVSLLGSQTGIRPKGAFWDGQPLRVRY